MELLISFAIPDLWKRSELTKVATSPFIYGINELGGLSTVTISLSIADFLKQTWSGIMEGLSAQRMLNN